MVVEDPGKEGFWFTSKVGDPISTFIDSFPLEGTPFLPSLIPFFFPIACCAVYNSNSFGSTFHKPGGPENSAFFPGIFKQIMETR